MAKLLDESILATIVYYDVVGSALNALEIYKYLINLERFSDERLGSVGLGDVVARLDESEVLKMYVSSENGYYFLNGSEGLFEKRMEDRKRANATWNHLARYVRRLQTVPFIRGVFVSGSNALGTASDQSDLDVLIVTKHGRIWTTRFLVTLMVHLWGVRRYGRLTKDRICLNHFVTDKDLHIKHHSLYNAQTYLHLVPVLGDLREDFYSANQWIYEYCGSREFDTSMQDLRVVSKSWWRIVIRKISEGILMMPLGALLESALKSFQKRRIDADPRTKERGGRVIATDTELEFHPQSHEYDILQRYNRDLVRLKLTQYAKEQDSGLQ